MMIHDYLRVILFFENEKKCYFFKFYHFIFGLLIQTKELNRDRKLDEKKTSKSRLETECITINPLLIKHKKHNFEN